VRRGHLYAREHWSHCNKLRAAGFLGPNVVVPVPGLGAITDCTSSSMDLRAFWGHFLHRDETVFTDLGGRVWLHII